MITIEVISKKSLAMQSINIDNQTQNRTTDRERNMPEIEREKTLKSKDKTENTSEFASIFSNIRSGDESTLFYDPRGEVF